MTIRFDLAKQYGKFKPLNATNGGPWYKRHAADQFRSNFEDYKAARIPYSRNHDSNASGVYGGPFAHDVSVIFPRFEADPCDPASYDFACTDEAILACLDAGTQTFFRLGETIEHQIKKHHTLPPADFKKWAVVCEHIIRHYNEGWADGLHLGIKYWEIWNEPDLDHDDSPNKRTWGGTEAQFHDFFETAAKHLKSCFPDLNIGGPASAGNHGWVERFLCEMQKRNVPLDFLSWHIYCVEPEQMLRSAYAFRAIMDKYGYEKAESICNEWNYVADWGRDYVESLKVIHGAKGAAFTMGCIALSQSAPVDMLMYYDTRPSVFCGAFDFYTYETLPGYYPLYWFGMLYGCTEVRAEEPVENIYTLCGVDENGLVTAIITHYSNRTEVENKKIALDFGKKDGKYDVYLLDENKKGELVESGTDRLEFDMKVCSCILVKERPER
ncbi:MAG: hypothetical protein IJY86_04155 [Clostridia bacterium]|nr:hypothetical protein [Clostridia bacterium]